MSYSRSSISSSPLNSPQSWSRHRQEELINAYEAEEERIINVLNRKLEKLKEEKVDLENTLEAESESHVNRLSRELTAMRMAAAVSQSQSPSSTNGIAVPCKIPEPSPEVMLESLRRENESLRNRLVDIERDYIRISRLNEIYREELIEHRNRLGLPVDSLVGLADPSTSATHGNNFYPNHARRRSTSRPAAVALPIPRATSQIHLPSSSDSSASDATTAETSSLFSFSGINSVAPHAGTGRGNVPSARGLNNGHTTFPGGGSVTGAVGTSVSTNLTTPASTNSQNTGVHFATPLRGLTYPSVPPPSLSSSFGSPNISYFPPGFGTGGNSPPISRRSSLSLVSSRRGSVGGGGTTTINGNNPSTINGRVAETGSLIRSRSRAGSASSSEYPPPALPLAMDEGLGGVDESVEELEFDPGESVPCLRGPSTTTTSGTISKR